MSPPLPAELAGRAVDQIGIVVRDLDAAARRYSDLWQNGPWRCWTYGPGVLREQSYRGETGRFSVRIALNATVPQVELLQPLAGPSIYHEWLEEHGESLHHVALWVESLDETVASMAAGGYGVLQSGLGMGADGSGGFAYFDTQAALGLILEAVERPAARREPEVVIP